MWLWRAGGEHSNFRLRARTQWNSFIQTCTKDWSWALKPWRRWRGAASAQQPDRGGDEHLLHHLVVEELVHHLDVADAPFSPNGCRWQMHHSLWMSPCLACISPKPQPTPPSKSRRRFLQASIFLRTILHINIIRIEPIVICTEKLTKEIRAWRVWEVLDEGVGGSLTTHLQEVCYQAARVNKV